MEGLRDVLRLDLLRMFDTHKLELFIGGMMETDMDDLMRFADYCGTRRRTG